MLYPEGTTYSSKWHFNSSTGHGLNSGNTFPKRWAVFVSCYKRKVQKSTRFRGIFCLCVICCLLICISLIYYLLYVYVCITISITAHTPQNICASSNLISSTTFLPCTLPLSLPTVFLLASISHIQNIWIKTKMLTVAHCKDWLVANICYYIRYLYYYVMTNRKT